jgi:GntR family transcriptional regulator, sialic acid-inducible nan operon repressor
MVCRLLAMAEVDFAADLLPATHSPVDRAYQYIASLIDLKRVPHGGLLPRAELLAKEIGVSRPSVLTALGLLEKQGLVRVGTGRAGVRVAELVGASRDARVAWLFEHRRVIDEMATLRVIVEPGVMRLVAEGGVSKSLRSRAHELQEEMCGPVDHQGYLAADTEFHRLLVSACGAPSIERLSLLIRRWVAPALDLIVWPPNRRNASNTEHEQLLAAIEAQDQDAAEQAIRLHIDASTKSIHQLLASMEAVPAGSGATAV